MNMTAWRPHWQTDTVHRDRSKENVLAAYWCASIRLLSAAFPTSWETPNLSKKTLICHWDTCEVYWNWFCKDLMVTVDRILSAIVWLVHFFLCHDEIQMTVMLWRKCTVLFKSLGSLPALNMCNNLTNTKWLRVITTTSFSYNQYSYNWIR